MGVVEAIILGIVQGITEWLPVSSTAHLRIVPALLGWSDPGAAFTAVIQLGTVLAVLIYFRSDLGRVFSAWFKSFSDKQVARSPDAKMGWAIFVGTLPIVVLGKIFEKTIKGELRSLTIIAASLIIMGLIMLIADRVGRKQRPVESVVQKDGLIVGIWQAVALIPGMSRSGSTISGGLFAGFDRAAAARFSFLLSVPSVLAAGVKELIDERKSILGANLTPALVATIVSFIVGYWSISFLMKFLQTKSTISFVVYRVVLGILILALIKMGSLDPMAGVH